LKAGKDRYTNILKRVLKELTFKPILEEVEKCLNQAPEEDIRILSLTSAFIKATEAKNYPLVISVDRDEEGFLRVSSVDERHILTVAALSLGSNIPNIRSLFYRYLLGFQDDARYMRLMIYPFTINYVERLANEVSRYVRIPERSEVESRISDLYVKGEFLKLAIIERSTRFGRISSEFLSYFSGMPYEHLCEWATIEV
jgi:hypothetical protein